MIPYFVFYDFCGFKTASFSRMLMLLASYCLLVFQYNSWFTFSEFEEPVKPRSCRPIHARELTTVSFSSEFYLIQKEKKKNPNSHDSLGR